MDISNEFTRAVGARNVLRVKIMLKDSLLVDKTFRLFDEMEAYASKHGVNPWSDTHIQIEQAAKPWTEDIMNYELTALINNFTKEHVQYVKDIISDLYKMKQHSESASNQHSSPSTRRSGSVSSSSSASDPYGIISKEGKRIYQILNNSKKNNRWMNEDIKKIKKSAQIIVSECNSILKE